MTSKAWPNGSTRRWRTARAAVLAANEINNGGRCTLRIEGKCTGMADCVHHTKGRAVTGDDPAHMVAACMGCNLFLGDVTAHDPEPTPQTNW